MSTPDVEAGEGLVETKTELSQEDGDTRRALATTKALQATTISDLQKNILRRVNDFVVDEHLVDKAGFKTYSDWYLLYLKTRIESLVNSGRAAAVLAALYPSPLSRPKAYPDAFVDMWRLLSAIATCLSTPNSSLQSIAFETPEGRDAAVNPSLQAPLFQLIFTLASWLTMLYTPAVVQASQSLQLSLPDSTKPNHRLRTTTWHKFSCPITDDSTSLPIRHLLSCFGNFLHRAPFRSRAAANNLQPSSFYDDNIVASYINYHTLTRIGKMRIEWVDSLSLHLEFDERSAVLKLFRYPSFAAMLCVSRDSKSNIFAKIFSTGDPDSDADSLNNPIDPGTTTPGPYTEEFFYELLLTYRLLFTSHSPSRRSFSAHELRSAPLQSPPRDPLLSSFGAKNDRATAALFTQIDAPLPKSVYDVRSDFPTLGPRLTILQNYMVAQNPSDLRTLWYDRRDTLRFYTFWAVFIVGGASILLAIIQTVLAGVQVANM